jgi:hypothetical protein
MSRDIRKYAGQTNVRMVVGGILLFLIVGIGLIYFFYDLQAALMGLLCMVLGFTPLLLIWIILWLIELIARRANEG